MKKRMIAILATGIMCMAMPMTAFAEEANQEITATLTADPTYSVTIPASVSMGNEGTAVDVTASEVANLPEGQKISVTFEGTDDFMNQTILQPADSSTTYPQSELCYQIISENGTTIETNFANGTNGAGQEVVSFTEDGTKQYTIKPVLEGDFEYGVEYSGSIIFGIGLTENA
ncbi:MAG: hypothetical protein ACOX8H_00695 [Ruminococcus sp.]